MEDLTPLKGVHYAMDLLLKEVDRICKKHNITYYLWGGTLLGAVRHENFIPWDDDVDVTFKRPDFEKFCEIAPKELGEHFRLVMPGEDDKYFDMIPKLNYVPSKIHNHCEDDDFYHEKHNKVSLDVFCADTPCEGFMFKLQLLRLKQVYGYAMGHRRVLDMNDYKGLTKLYVKVFSIIGKTMSMKTINKKYRKVSMWGHSKDKYFISNDRIMFAHLQFNKQWLEDTAEYKIGDGKYTATKFYDEYLTYIYKDYMKLPPEEKRLPEHTGRLNEIEVFDFEGNKI